MLGTLGLSSRFWTGLRSCSTSTRSKISVFLNQDVQKELKFLTGMDYDRVFRVPRRGEKLRNPIYKFVTDAQLSKMQTRAKELAEKKLQMPPVMDERKPINKVLEVDEALKGYDSMPIVFTDITYGVHDRNRIIVVREPNGTLREAEWDERDRLNLIYFPKEGRKHDLPPMFREEYLQEILKPDKYLYILDRNCVQFEPDHPIFIKTASTVYEDISQKKAFDALYSTRHYGPMVFHLVWERHCDDLIIYYLQKLDIEKALSVIRVYREVHPASESAKSGKEGLDLLRLYISEDAIESSKIRNILESALEDLERQKEMNADLEGSHGLQSSDQP